MLQNLQQALADSGFALAGGTSLALRFGHRLSVDLDFFTLDSFEPESLANKLGLDHSAITGIATGTLQVFHDNIKIEFIRHSYPALEAIECIDGIRLWSIPDVAAMKINAIINRGSKKDFYDLAALLEHQSLENILEQYRKKYQPGSLFMAIRSLAWFEDANAEPDPKTITSPPWSDTVKRIEAAIRQLH